MKSFDTWLGTPEGIEADAELADWAQHWLRFSTGAPATLTLTGNRSASFRDLRVAAEGLPGNSFCLLLASPDPGFASHPAGSQGNLCLGGSVSRFTASAGAASPAGTFAMDLDLAALPTPQQGPYAVRPGDTFHFQYWYRDANPTPTSNFSEAKSVLFN